MVFCNCRFAAAKKALSAHAGGHAPSGNAPAEGEKLFASPDANAEGGMLYDAE